MLIRYFKTLLVAFVAFHGLHWGLVNFYLWQTNFTEISPVLALEGTWGWPGNDLRAVTNPLLASVIIAVLYLSELSVGIFCALGVKNLWSARAGPNAGFHNAKKYAVAGCTMALVIWFGFFIIVGGDWFLMWQSEVGGFSLALAFKYVGSIGLVLLFLLNQSFEEQVVS